MRIALSHFMILVIGITAHATEPTADSSYQIAFATPAWVQVVEKAAFSPRDTAEDIVYQDKMWLSNGYYHGNILTRDLWSSSDGIEWTRVNASTPYDGYSEMAVYGGKMWAIKGSVWCSTDGVEWTCVLEKTPFATPGYNEVVVFQDRMWQLGCGKEVWYTTDGKDWTLAQSNAPYGDRVASAIVVFHNKLWLMGGRTEKQNTPPEKGYPQYTTLNDVWCSSDGIEWKKVLDAAPWAPRMWFPVRVYRDQMWVIGGYDNRNHRNLGDIWYTRDGIHWQEFVSENRFSPRHEPSSYVFKDSLWVVAGNSWPVLNDVWRLTLPVSP